MATAHATRKEVEKEIPNSNIILLELDLASLDSVKKAAEQVLETESRLDILMNNGGIAFWPPMMTTDGYEIHFGTNFLGHALLTLLLMPTLLCTAAEPDSDVRIINVASHGHVLTPAGGIDFERVKSSMISTGCAKNYGMSKLAVILYTQALAQRYPSIKSIAVNTGPVSTSIMRGAAISHPWITAIALPLMKLFFRSVEVGAKNQLWCSVSQAAESGAYYDPIGKVGARSELSRSEELADRLWTFTEDELTLKKFLIYIDGKLKHHHV